MWHITNRSLVASIQLAHVPCDDQGFLIMGNYVNDSEVMYRHDGHTPNTIIVMRSVTKLSTLQQTKKKSNLILRL
jgi:hypothetical protein